MVDRSNGKVRWRAFVGDGPLGELMHHNGRLSVALDPAGASLTWPEGSRLSPAHAAALQSLCRDVLSFARSRRELALVMMSSAEIRHGNVVARRTAGDWPGRLAQALVIATDVDDRRLADTIRMLTRSQGVRTVGTPRPRHGPDVAQAERDRQDALYLDRVDLEQDVEGEVRYWLTQFSEILGRIVSL
ncbi:hypothetical protein GCM10010435_47230 [Winogradskya consettensis]|uniref:Uncharacterized protein n=1 Tax=Winogradskya consettensis TaxID=113560 RepID=A0A919SIZ7_9ACTN|nr:hypothetical protein [Actinoplanes consettensis]GIM72830.1 hypothetical protein Aco04nite_32160 [Actinoplanes consettensis]